MPILIVLKNPRMNIIAKGEIKDNSEKEWDEIFHNQVLMTKNQAGHNMLVPLLQDCNIAIMEEITDKEIEEMKKMAEKRAEEMEAQGKGGRGNLISQPNFVIPHGRSGRS